eukprot:m.294250 g.294250  ORF g.294250 m.294250 type:complete len:73 (-) comp12952_c0_seq1:217-435(-)
MQPPPPRSISPFKFAASWVAIIIVGSGAFFLAKADLDRRRAEAIKERRKPFVSPRSTRIADDTTGKPSESSA